MKNLLKITVSLLLILSLIYSCTTQEIENKEIDNYSISELKSIANKIGEKHNEYVNAIYPNISKKDNLNSIKNKLISYASKDSYLNADEKELKTLDSYLNNQYINTNKSSNSTYSETLELLNLETRNIIETFFNDFSEDMSHEEVISLVERTNSLAVNSLTSNTDILIILATTIGTQNSYEYWYVEGNLNKNSNQNKYDATEVAHADGYGILDGMVTGTIGGAITGGPFGGVVGFLSGAIVGGAYASIKAALL